MAVLSPPPKLQFFDAAGVPLVGGKLYSYAAGTTTPLATYTSAAETAFNTNPIILNSRGEAEVWLGSPLYKFKLTTAADVEIWTVDNITSLSGLQASLLAAIAASAASTDASIKAYFAATSGSSRVGYISSGTGAVARTVQDKIRETPLYVTDFGAVGDNTTPCDAAFAACFAAAKAQRRPWHIPAGTYLFTTTGTTFWNMTGSEFFGMKITGDGAGNTILRFPNVTTNIGLQIYASSDWYDFAMSDLQFQFQTATAGMVLGQNSFVDPMNTPNLTNIIILNTLNSSATEGLRLNYVVNGLFNNVRANCYASASGGVLTAVNGMSLRCRQVGFCTFNNGSYGNGTYGVRFTDTFNFGNVWVGTDFENVEYCVRGDGSATGNNLFLGGQFANYMRAALSNAGGLSTGAYTVISPNFNNPPAWATPGTNPLGVAATVIDQTNFGGIRLIDGTPVTTPAVPASGVAAANISGKRLLVTFWGGSVTSVSVNGFGIGISGSGSVMLPHAQTIALTYTGSPNWFWQPLE
jgi:hypothetical protein